MSASIRTINDFTSSADAMVIEKLALELETSELATLINNLKSERKNSLETRKKKIKSLQGKLLTWIRKEAPKLFGGATTGTYESTLAKISWKNNPPALAKIDKDEPEEALIERATIEGFDFVVKTVHSINKEALSELTDEQLRTIGWQRTKSKSLTITALAKTDSKQSKKDPVKT